MHAYGREDELKEDYNYFEEDIDKNIFNQLQQKSLVNPSGSEITREMFLEGL